MLLSAPLIIPPYEIMQLQTSIRSCEGNHYVVTVINDAAENSGLLSNNSCAQGAFEGRGPVAKETDEIQNGPRATVLLSFPFLSLWPTNRFFFSPSLKVFSRCFETSCRAVFFFFRDFENVYVRVDLKKKKDSRCLGINVEHLTLIVWRIIKKCSWWRRFTHAIVAKQTK